MNIGSFPTKPWCDKEVTVSIVEPSLATFEIYPPNMQIQDHCESCIADKGKAFEAEVTRLVANVVENGFNKTAIANLRWLNPENIDDLLFEKCIWKPSDLRSVRALPLCIQYQLVKALFAASHRS